MERGAGSDDRSGRSATCSSVLNQRGKKMAEISRRRWWSCIARLSRQPQATAIGLAIPSIVCMRCRLMTRGLIAETKEKTVGLQFFILLLLSFSAGEWPAPACVASSCMCACVVAVLTDPCRCDAACRLSHCTVARRAAAVALLVGRPSSSFSSLSLSPSVMEELDYYAALDLKREATDSQIKQASVTHAATLAQAARAQAAQAHGKRQ